MKRDFAVALGRLGGLIVGALPRRPPAFQERDAVREVAEMVGAGGPAAVCVLAGRRGVGKTQTAAAYVRMRLHDGYPLVVWTSAATPQSLLADYAAASEQLGVADPHGDSERSALRLKAYLQELAVPSVLVIDNAVRQPGKAVLDWLEQLLPTVGGCEVVITTTDHGFGELGDLVEVGVFERAQSVTYLSARTGRNDADGADKIADVLGDLPAALAGVPAVLWARGWSYTRYLRAAEVVVLHEVALAAREQLLGPGHPDTMASRNNLATAYQDAGHAAEAVALFERTLADCERLFGPDHRDTLTSRNNLALAYQEAGDSPSPADHHDHTRSR